MNPFKSVLFNIFVKEREHAIRVGSGGLASENEQLVWVLWKILKGDGNDVSVVNFFHLKLIVDQGWLVDWSVFSGQLGEVPTSA
jgi:hypothetical protein